MLLRVRQKVLSLIKTEGNSMDVKIYLLFWGVLIFTTSATGVKRDLGFVKKEAIKIKVGTHECISNCSGMSTEGNVFMECAVEECGRLKFSSSTAQPSEIERKDIFFEKYTDESEQRNRLALHIKWSPVDNVSLQDTTGYLIDITDGETSYSRCYHITTPMNFSNNAHDKFFNDCFGKAQGTRVRPKSNITVHITTLPLWDHNKDDGMVTIKIEVPDCTNEELHTFQECETDGGRPTTRSCAESCDVSTIVDGIEYPVTCTTSQSTIQNFRGREDCDKVNKTSVGLPTPPKHIPQDQEWYKFIDPKSQDVKIALNFSWMPRMDSSITDLHGYRLEILPTKRSDLTNFDKCFAIHTNLTLKKHQNARFFYDCYGRVNGSFDIEPGLEYLIHLNSEPYMLSEETFHIKIPNCGDKRVQDVTFCKRQKNRVLYSSVDAIFCNNRSIKYSYESSSHNGKFVDIVLCKTGKLRRYCGKELYRWENLVTAGTLYNVSLPSTADLSVGYTIFLHRSEYPGSRSVRYFNFTECISHKPSTLSTFLISIIAIIAILIVMGVLFLALFFYRKECNFFKEWIPNIVYRRQEPMVVIARGAADDEFPPPEPAEPTAVISSHTRVYVVFCKDCEQHVNAVHYFCSYLKYDLGLDVRLSIWEEKLVAVNPIQYMESNLKNAEKVVVICSRGSRGCLSETEYDGNLFTPVVRKICQQSFIGQNPGKFLVGYFPYSEQEDVPELLRDQCLMYFSLFKLMKQFEQFYFRLIAVEQYQEGGIQRIDKIAFDRYHERELTSWGMDLKISIERMETYVHEHPTWFTDEHGADMPQALTHHIPRPMPSLHDTRSITDPVRDGGSITRVYAKPPPVIPMDESRATRPKIQNTEPLPLQPLQQSEMRPHWSSKPATKMGGYREMTSVASASTDSSFIIPETEAEDLSSCSLTGQESPTPADERGPHRYPQRKKMSVGSFQYQLSFHPDSFSENDFGPADNDEDIGSSLLTNMPSNVTQITRLGLSESMERLRDGLHQNIPLFQSFEDGDDGMQDQRSPESGVFTLANVEEDMDDIEDQIKSINQSHFP